MTESHHADDHDHGTAQSRDTRLAWAALLAVLIVTATAYEPVWEAGFTNWDDDAYVTDNPTVQHLTPDNLLRFFTDPHAGLYQPLTMVSLAIDYQLGGGSPTWSHATNLLLHLINTLMVFCLIRRLRADTWIALGVAAFFALHPLHVESVAWITERKDVLYTFFFLISLISYSAFVTRSARRDYWIALVAFGLALLAKAQAVALAPTLLLIDYLFGRKLSSRQVLWEKAPFFLLALLGGVGVLVTQSSAGALDPITGLGVMDRLILSSLSLLMYLVRHLIPLGLSAVYPLPDWVGSTPPWSATLLPALAAIVLAGLFYLLRKNRSAVFGLGFFLVNLVLMLQWLPAGTAYQADRFSYVASIGLFWSVLVVVGAFRKRGLGDGDADGRADGQVERRKGGRAEGTAHPTVVGPSYHVTRFLLLPYLIWLAVLTHQRAEVWTSSETLWSDVIEKYPQSELAWNNRGAARVERGLVEEGLRDYRRAIRLNPEYPAPHENRGIALAALGDLDGAVASYRVAVSLAPENHTVYYNLGLALDRLGAQEEAIANYSRAIELRPTFAQAYYSRGGARGNTGDLDGAMRDFSRAIELRPDFGAAYRNRGIARAAAGNDDEACEDWFRGTELGDRRAGELFSESCGP